MGAKRDLGVGIWIFGLVLNFFEIFVGLKKFCIYKYEKEKFVKFCHTERSEVSQICTKGF